MSQYDTEPNTAAEGAGREAIVPKLAPFLPADQSGGRNTIAHSGTGQPVGSNAALPANVGSVSLHAKAEFSRASTFRGSGSTHVPFEPHGPAHRREPTNRKEDIRGGGSTRHSRVECHLPHTCATCSTSFPRNYQLEQHAAKDQHKAYLCTCGKGFTRLSAMGRHVKEITQTCEHQCPLCDTKFKRPGHVEQHLQRIHQMSKDAIKDLLNGQKSQPRQEPGQAITDSAAVAMTGPIDAQAVYPFVFPSTPWTGPIDFSMAPADHPGSRPEDFSASLSGLPTSDAGFVTATSAFPLQNFMTQAPELPAYPGYPAAGMATQTGIPANAAPDFVGYPAAHLNGDLGLFNIDPALVSMNPGGGFEMPDLEIDFMEEFIGSGLNTFNF